MLIKTSMQLKPSSPITDLSGFLVICHSQPGCRASKRNATEITRILESAGIKTIGEFLAHPSNYFDKLSGLGNARYQMLIECHTYLNASGIDET